MKKPLMLLLFPLLLPSCSYQKADSNVLYASFYPIYDFAQRIVRGKMTVKNLTPYGSEPHDFEPSVRQVAEMTEGKAFLANGLSLEGYLSSLPKEVSDKTYVVTEGIETRSLNGIVDPHVWLSLPNAQKEMERICSIVSKLDPENASYYADNLAEEKERFSALESQYRPKFASMPRKTIVVSHAAFGYLCAEYGLEQIYVSGLSPSQEPSPKQLETILSLVKEKGITTVFYEELASDAIVKKIASETGAKVEILNPLEGLSQEEQKTEDYLSVMEENYRKIWEACR